MLAIEQQTISPSLANRIESAPAHTVPEGVATRIKDLLLPESSHVLVAPLPANNFRLLQAYDVLGGPVRKVEIIESRRGNGPNHARLYLAPEENHIPTLIVGEYAAVAHCALRDGQPAFPLLPETQAIDTGSLTLKYPDDLVRLPGIDALLRNQSKVMFTVRPSSFWLQRICMLEAGGVIVKAKVYENHFAPGQAFCHVTSSDEWSGAFPDGLHGVVLTNSETYAGAHPELGFAEA